MERFDPMQEETPEETDDPDADEEEDEDDVYITGADKKKYNSFF
jgi:hypothetical protein